MNIDKNMLDDLHSLSMQLNRQAFASPPMEGWLNSFLTMLFERFSTANVQGIQVAQVIGNVAVQMGSAGVVPGRSSDQYPLDDSSPIAAALSARHMASAADSRVYPIMIGDDVVGVLVIYTTQTDEIRDQALEMLALQLGPAIMQNLKTPRPQTGRLTRQIEMMRSVNEATRTVGSVLEGSEGLNRSARSVVEALRVEHTEILVYDYAQGIGTVIAEYPDYGHLGVKIQLRGAPVQDRLLQEHTPIVIPNAAESTELGVNQDMLLGFGLKGLVILPMMIQDRVIGSVNLNSYQDGRTFTPEEIEAAVTIASQLAVNLRNAQLYDDIKHRASQLERIADLSRHVTSTFNRFEIFEIVKEETQNLIESNLISVALRSTDNARLQLFILDSPEPTPVEFPMEQTALSQTITSLEPVVLDDISGSDRPDYRLLAQSGMRAAVIIPLAVGGRAIGTFNVLHAQAGRYLSIDLAVLEQVGNQLAIALENARLYAQAAQRVEIEQLMNRLTSSIQSRGDMQGMLLASVHQMAEALNARRARVRLQMLPAQAADTSKVTDRIISKLSKKSEK
ncbi:MAG: GAF domain-containing protein [Chloroflexota bacterium]